MTLLLHLPCLCRCPYTASVEKWQPGLCDCDYWTGYWGSNCTLALLICTGLLQLNEDVQFLTISNLRVLYISVGGGVLNDFRQPGWRLCFVLEICLFCGGGARAGIPSWLFLLQDRTFWMDNESIIKSHLIWCATNNREISLSSRAFSDWPFASSVCQTLDQTHKVTGACTSMFLPFELCGAA